MTTPAARYSQTWYEKENGKPAVPSFHGTYMDEPYAWVDHNGYCRLRSGVLDTNGAVALAEWLVAWFGARV